MRRYLNLINIYLKDYVIDINDSIKFQEILQNIISRKINRIDLCIQSNGGFIKDNDVLINNLLNFKGEIRSFIPKYAYSAATMLALCGTKIILNQTSVLGPTDPVVEIRGIDVSVKSLLTLLEQKNQNIEDLLLLQIYDNKKYYDENLIILRRIFLKKNLKKKIINNLIKIFGSGNMSHDSPLTKQYLESKGLKFYYDSSIDSFSNILNNIYKLYYI